MTENVKTLPEGYRKILSVDLQKDKKLAWLVNGAAIVITVVMAIIGQQISPFRLMVQDGRGILRLIVLLAGYFAYILLHELVHGIFMQILSGERPHYGFTGLYAFAGIDYYFNKKSYILIALAPVVVWGIVLAVLVPLVPPAWFWVVWIIQIGNISGAAGDYYVTLRFMKLPQDILVSDTGVSMSVYAH